MVKLILRIYDFLSSHRKLCLLSFMCLTTGLFVLFLKLDFNEDISAFLPLDKKQQEALAVYQDVSGASKILAIFQSRNSTEIKPEDAVKAIDSFSDFINDLDTTHMVRNLMTEFDMSKITEVTDFVYSNIPYFLSDEDYVRIDSLLSDPGYVRRQLDKDKQMLMFPSGGLLSENLRKDPLNLFSPVVSKLRRSEGADVEMYDGYIFTPDVTRAIVMMDSPFGSSETQHNSDLMRLLEQVADSVEVHNPEISLHYIGGPAIAVGNSNQIKKDSILSVTISLILIIALLVFVFRKVGNILLIVVSVAWGWLFAMAMLSVIHDTVSLIVVGISSIILGIAVNYPLHLIAHTAHVGSMKQTLKEIVSPLIIGNVTTVGAFIALVPLKAVSLRDLGIFSSLILIGTIFFVVIYLPHLVKTNSLMSGSKVRILDMVSNIRLENKKWIVVSVAVLTCLFGYFSFSTRFDANMSHINFMTDRQKADMDYFNQFTSGETKNRQCVYVVSTGSDLDEALDNSAALHDDLANLAKKYGQAEMSSCNCFLTSSREMGRRLKHWNQFVKSYNNVLVGELKSEAHNAGFAENAFDEFNEIISVNYMPKDFDYFHVLQDIYSSNLSCDPDTGHSRVVDCIYVPSEHVESMKADINNLPGNHFCFDVVGMNSTMANSLSDNFNYIGWACCLIVFFFLWFSFRSVELAILSFLPMAVSWIWILGIMGITGIQFNIVNIILATFIFGQGDDYTIFMTEGCSYEYAYRKPMLSSYKNSIIVSALIMFVGIGTLIFAKHPALHSLAEVTVVGMFSVVLMAYLLPPFVFNAITRIHGQYRIRPITICALMRASLCYALWILILGVSGVCNAVFFAIGIRKRRRNAYIHKMVYKSCIMAMKLIPGVGCEVKSMVNLRDDCHMIICNHQSAIDTMLIMALSPDITIVTERGSKMNPFLRSLVWINNGLCFQISCSEANCDTVSEHERTQLRELIDEGYSLIYMKSLIKEGEHVFPYVPLSAINIASMLRIDIVPVCIHGSYYIMPDGISACYKGKVQIDICSTIVIDKPGQECNVSIVAEHLRRELMLRYAEMKNINESCDFFKSFVYDRYRYKGTEITSKVRGRLARMTLDECLGIEDNSDVVLYEQGYGELALTIALLHPESKINAYIEDDERRTIAYYAAKGIVSNLFYAKG